MNQKKALWLIPLLTLLLLCIACNGLTGDRQGNSNEPGFPETVGEADEISIVTPEPDLHRDELDAILLRGTMLEGVSIGGVNVSGMTLDEARAAVAPALEAKKKDLQISVTFGDESEVFSSESIRTENDLDAAISEAFSLVREDTGFESVSAEVERIKTQGMDFPIHVMFNETALEIAVNAFADSHEIAPVDAAVSYNEKENKIDFTPDVSGRKVNREALFSALLDAEGGETLEAPSEEIPAEVTLSDIQNKYVLRGTCTTKFSKSIKNRKFNICKGVKLISGTILHPGDTFSANGTLGVRNKTNGWKVATAYVQGAHEKQYGGGVCQLSSTLYNAAVLADMKIVKRQNHSMPVDYVHKGLDATINSIGNPIDFKFQNSSKADVIIIAYVDKPDDYTKAGVLTMEIWGIPIIEDSDGKYDEIRIPEPKKLKTLYPSGDVEYRVDETKKPGYKEQIVKNQNGSVWQSYVEYYLNGELVERKELDQSTYKAYKAVYIVGPDAPEDDPTENPENTPKPTDEDDTPDPDETPKPDPTPKPTDEDDTPKPEDTPKPDPTPKPTDPSGDDDE